MESKHDDVSGRDRSHSSPSTSGREVLSPALRIEVTRNGSALIGECSAPPLPDSSSSGSAQSMGGMQGSPQSRLPPMHSRSSSHPIKLSPQMLGVVRSLHIDSTSPGQGSGSGSNAGSTATTPREVLPRESPTHRSSTPRNRPIAHSLVTSRSLPSTPTHQSRKEKKESPPSQQGLLLDPVYENSGEESKSSSPRLSLEEKKYHQTYFGDLLESIEKRDHKWFEMIAGVEKYDAWLRYVRDQHKLVLPTLNDFYKKIVDFIGNYEKMWRLEQLYHSVAASKSGMTPIPNAHAKNDFKRINQARSNPQSPAAAAEFKLESSAMELPMPEMVQGEEIVRAKINQAYQDATAAYKERGVMGYLDVMGDVEVDLQCYQSGGEYGAFTSQDVKVVLSPEKLVDFNQQLEHYVENTLISEFLANLKEKLTKNKDALSLVPTRYLNESGMEYLYERPWKAQYEVQVRKVCKQFWKFYVENGYSKISSLVVLRNKIQKILNHLPVPVPEKKLAEDYIKPAVNAYRELHRENENGFKTADLRKHYNVERFAFVDKMIVLCDSMKFDAFARMSDEDGNTVAHHLFAAYRMASSADRVKLQPIVFLAFKHGSLVYQPNAMGEDAIQFANRKAAENKAAENKKEHKEEDQEFPDWFLLRMINEFMPTFNPMQECVRSALCSISLASENDAIAWFGIYRALFVNEKMREKTRRDVMELTKELFLAQQFFTDSHLIGRIAHLKARLETCTLYSDRYLNSVLMGVGRNIGEGPLIAFPGFPIATPQDFARTNHQAASQVDDLMRHLVEARRQFDQAQKTNEESEAKFVIEAEKLKTEMVQLKAKLTLAEQQLQLSSTALLATELKGNAAGNVAAAGMLIVTNPVNTVPKKSCASGSIVGLFCRLFSTSSVTVTPQPAMSSKNTPGGGP